MNNIFYALLLKQNIIKKRQDNKFLKQELDVEEDIKYKVEKISNSAAYNKIAVSQ